MCLCTRLIDPYDTLFKNELSAKLPHIVEVCDPLKADNLYGEFAIAL